MSGTGVHNVDLTKKVSKIVLKRMKRARWWWCTPLIPALGRQRQADF
jgi:tartrate dehydratase alpha subunit/fumarate hydratase class I-like protein